MIIFMFGIVLTIVLFIAMGFVRGEGMSWRVNKKQLLALVGVLVIVFSCYVSIPAGHTGVVTTFGSVENYTLEAGMHFKLPWQEVIKMDNRVQKSTQDMSCFSSDIQEVSMTYTVNYQISKQDAMTIYKTIGIGYYDTVIAPCITESVKIVTAQYTAEDLVSSRSLMASQIEEVLSQKLAAYNIELVGASIENMDFTDAFTDAVEAKQVAEQNKLRAETEAQQRVLEANAAAEIKRIEAEADAYELTTRAEAEAEAPAVGIVADRIVAVVRAGEDLFPETVAFDRIVHPVGRLVFDAVSLLFIRRRRQSLVSRKLVVEVAGIENQSLRHLLHVALALGHMGGCPRLLQRRQQHRGENCDDRDHHQEFDQCKGGIFLHGFLRHIMMNRSGATLKNTDCDLTQ